MSNTNIEDLPRETMQRVMQRDRFVKEQMSIRIANLMQENLELLGIVRELQEELAALRGTDNGEVITPMEGAEVAS